MDILHRQHPPLGPTFSPADDAFGVALDSNLVATFSETIQKGTGKITIHKGDGSVFEAIDVTTAAVTVVGGQGRFINPANDFVAGTGYHVLIDSTAIQQHRWSRVTRGFPIPTVWDYTAQA